MCSISEQRLVPANDIALSISTRNRSANKLASGNSHESLAEEHLRILVAPILRRQRLEVHDDPLEIHLLQLACPLVQEDCADVQMKIGECIWSFRLHRKNIVNGWGTSHCTCLTHKIGVPQPDDTLHRHLPHQQTIHPSKSKLHVLHPLTAQMRVQRRVDPRNQLSQSPDLPLNPRLRKDVIVLDPIEEL